MIPNRFCLPILAILVALAAGQAHAIEEPPRPPTSALSKIRDLAASVRARRALTEDPLLNRLNLGVEVENGIATLWGPIPSSDVARRAASRLRNVPGVLEVKHNFYIDRRENDLDLIARSEVPLRFDSAKPDSETGKLPILPDRPVTPATGAAAARPALSTPVAGVRPGGGPQLFAPRALSDRGGESRAPIVQVRRGLAQQVADVQQSDVRFRSIRVRVEDHTAVIVRGSNDPDRVMALYRKLRELRDVHEVLLADE